MALLHLHRADQPDRAVLVDPDAPRWLDGCRKAWPAAIGGGEPRHEGALYEGRLRPMDPCDGPPVDGGWVPDAGEPEAARLGRAMPPGYTP